MLLVTKDCIGYMPFDEESNDWESSELREWLNTDFTADFTEEEMSHIMTVTNEIILSDEEKDEAVAGDHPHYWNFTRNQVGDMSKTAYHNYLEDNVYIPTLDMMEGIDFKEPYWILCPYTGNGYMERYMNNDGFILHTDVASERGVRAVVRYIEQ